MRPGILSHTNTKINGVMNMRYWLNTNRAVTVSETGTLSELKTFVRYPNGTWRKKPGDNIFDDRVMALVWALFLLEDDIVSRYYDITESDDNGKPLRLASYAISNSRFKHPVYQYGGGNAPLPSVFMLNSGEDTQALELNGWTMF